MNIALLSGSGGWHVRDLQRAALALGHTATLVDFRAVSAALANFPQQGEDASTNTAVLLPPLTREARLPRDPDAVIVRTMPPGSLEQVVFRMDVLHRVETAGRRVVNSPRALETCIDKYLAGVRLEAAGLSVPPTIVCQDAEAALDAFHRLGGDVVVKPLFGSEGRGMVRVADDEIAWRTFRTLERLQTVLYLQQFVPHPGWDLRGFVIGNRIVAAMRRHACTGWRTNVAQGGRSEAVTLTTDEERLTLAAARAVGAAVAGVDLLPRPGGGYYVLEVNAVPGWRALARAAGVDVATEIIRYTASDER